MAKLVGPLLSESAHGKLAQSLVYSRRNRGNIVRDFYMPDKEITLKQWTQRHIIGLLTAHWQVMSAAERQNDEDLAVISKFKISGFNYFIKVAQADLYARHGLCGYWSMNELTGNKILDYSGNGIHGTLYPSYPTNCPERVDGLNKQYGKALKFDGQDDYVSCGTSALLDFGINSFSFGLLVYIVTSAGAWDITIWKGGGSAVSAGIDVELGTGAWITYISDGLGHIVAASFGSETLSQWIHLFVVVDRTTQKMYAYKNGIVVNPSGADISSVGSVTNTNQALFFSGNSNHNYLFKGTIDEVLFYNRILSAAEILKQYNLLRLDKKRQPLLIH